MSDQPTPAQEDARTPRTTLPSRIGLVVSMLRLGCTSFGGPTAHIGYFHAEWVERRGWLSETDFADLLALCQSLPGPTSSQMVFAFGLRQSGIVGAILASTCFTAPSALLMLAAAYGFTKWSTAIHGSLAGLKIAAAAVVALALWTMGRRMCADVKRGTIAVVVATLLLVWPFAGVQLAAIALGALGGALLFRDATRSPSTAPPTRPRTGYGFAVATLAGAIALLVALPVVGRMSTNPTFTLIDTFYRAGALVFGGGHVVLPLLRTGVVPTGWISDEAFLAGYGAAQALPGPLFSFSAYLGAIAQAGPGGLIGGLLCLLALFLPGWLFVAGALPFWETLRHWPHAQSCLAGANAAVVGVLGAAFIDPICIDSMTGLREVALAAAALSALALLRLPPWLVVVGCAVVGHLALEPG